MSMKKTTIYLEEEQLDALKGGASQSELIRTLLDKFFEYRAIEPNADKYVKAGMIRIETDLP